MTMTHFLSILATTERSWQLGFSGEMRNAEDYCPANAVASVMGINPYNIKENPYATGLHAELLKTQIDALIASSDRLTDDPRYSTVLIEQLLSACGLQEMRF